MDHITRNFAKDLFAGQHVLVSGGTSGIGLEIARAFAALGGQVTATGSSAGKIAALSKEATPGLRFDRLDVTDPAAITAFMQDFGALDVLVNAHGISRPDEEYEDAAFLQVMDINLTSVMRLSMAAMPALAERGGCIINVASMLSYLADPTVPAYGASKSGILGLTRALAHRFGPQGVRVNAVAPGYHKTALTEGLWADPVAEAKISGRTALKRWGGAEELSGATVFLATSAARYVTGATLAVDGGYVSG